MRSNVEKSAVARVVILGHRQKGLGLCQSHARQMSVAGRIAQLARDRM